MAGRKGHHRLDRRTLLRGVGSSAVLGALGAVGVRPAQATGGGGRLGAPRQGCDLFVDPANGNDGWAGCHPDPIGAGNGPLRTVQEAVDRALVRAGELAGDGDDRGFVNVWLRGGNHRLSEPVVMPPHHTDIRITFSSYPGETAIIDGGRIIDDWQETTVDGIDAWMTVIPEVASGDWYFRQLFVNGERRWRPRWPDVGHYNLVGLPEDAPAFLHSRLLANADDVRQFTNLSDVEMNLLWNWRGYRSPVQSIGESADGVVEITTELESTHLRGDDPYFFENVFEALTKPGQWYLDRPSGRLYYIPRPGEQIGQTEIVAPATHDLLNLIGDLDAQEYVEHITFRDLVFQNSDYVHVGAHPELGELASRLLMPGDGIEGRSASNQAEMHLPGMINMVAALDCTIEDCEFRNGGFYAIDLNFGCRDISMVGNDIHNMGGGGIKQSGGRLATDIVLENGEMSTEDEPEHWYTGWNEITDNHIHDGGLIFYAAVGVLSRHSPHNTISHNEIHDLRYSGISCGWNWGSYGMPAVPLEDPQLATVSDFNIIEKNHVYNIGVPVGEDLQLDDMGGIYIQGQQPHSHVIGNLIHDMPRTGLSRNIYLDGSTNGLTVTNNICYHASDAITLKGGNHVENNILVGGSTAVIRQNLKPNYTVPPAPRAYVVNNVLVANGAPVVEQVDSYVLSGPDGELACNENVLYDLGGAPLIYGKYRWRGSVQENSVHGLVNIKIQRDDGTDEPLITEVLTPPWPGRLRNNLEGYVGARIRVGASPVTVTALGRLVTEGNTGVHELRICGFESGLPLGTVEVSTASTDPRLFAYAPLPTPVQLEPDTEYVVISREFEGGDLWYSGRVTTSGGPAIVGPAYTNQPVGPVGLSFTEWQQLGQDVDSIVADPLFVDPDSGNYNLQAGSPAFDLGFEPIDMTDVGIRD